MLRDPVLCPVPARKAAPLRMESLRLDPGAHPYFGEGHVAGAVDPMWWRIAPWAAPVSSQSLSAIEGRDLPSIVMQVASPHLPPGKRLELAAEWLGHPPGLTPRIDRETGEIHYGPPLARLADPSWLRRVARKQWTRDHSHRARLAHPTKTEWCTSVDLAMRGAARERHARFTESMEMVADGATCRIPSRDDADHAKYAQLMAVCAGIAQIAAEAGMRPYLITITLPSQWHPTTTARGGGRRRNPASNQSRPSDGHAALMVQWQRFRAATDRRDIETEWVRAVQPHIDGCAHWHLVLWSRGDHWATIRKLLVRYFVDQMPDATGALTHHRLRIDRIRGGHAGAVAYVSRTLAYIGRATVGGSGSGTDRQKRDAAEAEATAGWASTDSIRRFSTSLTRTTVWRMLRRADVSVPAEWQAAQDAARDGRYADFLRTGGGIRAAYEDGKSRHGDPIQRLVGLRIVARPGTAETIIRPSRQWSMRRRAVAPRDASAAPWSFAVTVRSEGAAPAKIEEIDSKERAENDIGAQIRAGLGSTAGVRGPPARPKAITERM